MQTDQSRWNREILSLKRREAALWEERRRLLREWLPPFFVPLDFAGGLTEQQAWTLALFLHRQQWSRSGLPTALSFGTSESMTDRAADQVIHWLRCKLKPLGVQIETYRGKGFVMTRPMQEKCLALIAGRADAAPDGETVHLENMVRA